MNISRENEQLTQLNEMFVNALPSLSTRITNSVYYNKLRALLHSEIVYFCKEKTSLKQDLNFFRLSVGEKLTEEAIREYLDGLKEKYNNSDSDIGIEYHIEVTRIDFGVPVIVIIRRGTEIFLKKFVFRFKKNSVSESLNDVSLSGTPKGEE
jgi:hypothetical protein